MADVPVVITVETSGVDLASDLDTGDDELVLRVRTAGRPCMRCKLNAQKRDPRLPPLHARCHCVPVLVRKDSVSDVLH